jgi:hypothetical protein
MTMSNDRSAREWDKFVELPSGETAVRTTAKVTVDSMNLTAEMKVDSGHDLYEAENVTRTANLAVSFDSVSGLDLVHIQSVENKTKGWIYNTKGATVTDTSITLVAASQGTGYPVIAVGDEIEVIYRGTSRLTNDTQTAVALGVYNATEPSLSDGDKASLQLNEAGELKVTGGAGASSVNAEYISPADFSATYTSASTITLSGLPITVSNSAQVAYIKQVKADNTSRTYVNGANEITIAFAANVLTVYEKGAVITSLASGDVYEVGINGQVKSYDPSTQSIKTSSLNNVWNQYTDAETLVSAQDLTASYADFGAEIDMRGFTHLSVYIITDVNDSENVTLKLLGKHTSAGTDEYELDGGTTQALWTTGASDSKLHYEFNVKGTPFIQLQAIAGTVGGTEGDLTISITKIWKGE